MNQSRCLRTAGAALAAATLIASAAAAAADTGKSFTYTTKSPEAAKLLTELQTRIEFFQFGPDNVTLAQKIVAADPAFAMGQYYLSAVQPPPDNAAALAKAVVLAKDASDGERRFIEAMNVARDPKATTPEKALPLLEQLAADYPGERLVLTMLGQLYPGVPGQEAKARPALERALVLYPNSPRMKALAANELLLNGNYAQARATFESVEKELKKGAAPFVVRYGIAFSYLYEGKPDPAISALQTYLQEYKDAGLAQGFPEVFIWNSIARIDLENDRLPEALAAYQKGYESVPNSTIPDDQKQTWLGRLHHGTARTYARMGKHEEAWAEAETIRKMIEAGGEAGKPFLPAYHYLAGYLLLEKGDYPRAVEELKQSNQADPFHRLLLARAYEKVGDKESARKAYQEVVDSKANGIERALSYNEAKSRISKL